MIIKDVGFFLSILGIILVVAGVVFLITGRGSVKVEKGAALIGLAIGAVGLWLQVHPPGQKSQELGSLDQLTQYCQSKGYARTSYPRDVKYVKDWQCVGPGKTATYITNHGYLKWDDACAFEYGLGAYAVGTDAWDTAFGVKCMK
ncbi:hypothetical protein ABZ904_13635 [Streptomyces sp. NPDC046900]|uniref:hypothetical protein n=1 Tax=Streptomyces sp. NPDC046900 TaxID=3155473 RepID=UPI0033F8C67A